MRKALKILHSLASCGIIGGLAAYMLMLAYGPQTTPAQLADVRSSILDISRYLLLPSLGIVLVSGLLSMAVHRPFQEKRWVWLKALLGLGMFEATLALIHSKADYAAKLSAKIAAGAAEPELLPKALTSEWTSLWIIMAISVANVVLGVWRPTLRRGSVSVRTC